MKIDKLDKIRMIVKERNYIHYGYIHCSNIENTSKYFCIIGLDGQYEPLGRNNGHYDGIEIHGAFVSKIPSEKETHIHAPGAYCIDFYNDGWRLICSPTKKDIEIAYKSYKEHSPDVTRLY